MGSSAFDKGFRDGYTVAGYHATDPLADYAKGYIRGVLALRTEGRDMVIDTQSVTLEPDEQPQAQYRRNGDIVVSFRGRGGITSMTLDMTVEQATQLRDQIAAELERRLDTQLPA